MRKSSAGKIGFLCVAALIAVFYSAAGDRDKPAAGLETLEEAAREESARKESARGRPRTEALRGRVVWLADGLERRFGVKTVPEARENMLALETKDGQVLPIVEDLRGRSFRADERLRDMQVELLVRRYRRSPLVQVVRIHEIKDDGKYLLDYWCDICSIVMFETGHCDCCQDLNRLRKRLLDSRGNPVDQ